MIQYAPADTRAGLMEKCFNDDDVIVRRAAVQMIQYAPKDERSKLMELRKKMNPPQPDKPDTQNIPNRYLQTLATETPLYRQRTKRFFKRAFHKSGSGTTLLDIVPGQEDNSLKERVIIRHITAQSYFSWRKAFEASGYWKQHGFDYVPVEPIVSVKPTKGSFTHVDVYTRVIKGPSVAVWKKNDGSFIQEIDHQVKQITTGLYELGIEHGHTHEGNFVLYFQQKEDGTADLSQPPRIYVIDFDQAVSPV